MTDTNIESSGAATAESSEAEVAISVRDLVVKYGDRTVIDHVSFDVMRGENFVILGGSGGGKSTLLRTLVGLIEPYSGSIIINGEEFTAMSDAARIELRKKIGMSFQGSALFNSMSVAENVALPLKEHTKLNASTIDIMVQIKLDMVGLGGFEAYMPSELSGGMKKRAGLARAMAMDPEFIFYDEPSAGLDPIVAVGLDELIRELQTTFNLTSLIVTHELPSVRLISDRILMLKGGQVVALGTLDEMENSDDPFVRRFFERRPPEEGTAESGLFGDLAGID